MERGELLKNLVAAGANVVVSCGTPDLFEELISIAQQSGSHITIRMAGSPELFVRLAQLAGNQITFDFHG